MCECLPSRGVELKKKCVCGHFCVVFVCVCVCVLRKRIAGLTVVALAGRGSTVYCDVRVRHLSTLESREEGGEECLCAL